MKIVVRWKRVWYCRWMHSYECLFVSKSRMMLMMLMMLMMMCEPYKKDELYSKPKTVNNQQQNRSSNTSKR